jgi:hypothetical protein
MTWGQISGGAFRGEVRDASRAVVAGAQITIESKEFGRPLSLLTNGEGLYVTPDLVPGTYSVTATKTGFRAEVVGPITLPVNQTIRVDFALSIGLVTESVRVEASATQLLASESAEIGQVVTREQVSGIPLNGRRWQQLITLSAGVNPGSPGETGSPNPVNVNGQRTKGNLFLVDGISTTSSAQGRGNNFNMPLEAVQEFSVQAGSYSAEFGNVAGGVVNLQSKSGTNEWHGSAFEYFRNDKLDAANFFSNATGQAKNPLRYNQFGGAIGGPLQREGTFLFADYQGTISTNASPMVTTVPSNAQRQGDFSNLRNPQGGVVPIYDPFEPTIVRPMFPGNQIPLSRLDPAATRISALLPQPNQFQADGMPRAFSNYALTRAAESDLHAFDVRLDHPFSGYGSIFVRHSFQDTASIVPSVFGSPLGGTVSGAGTTRARNQNTGIGHTGQLKTSILHEFRLGLNRQTTALLPEDYGRNLAAEFGIPGVNRDAETSGLPTLVVSGVFNAGASILTPLRIAATNWTCSEKLTWIRGRHTVRTGLEGGYEMGSSGYRVFGRGYYTFLNLTTSTAAGAPGGDAFASFLLGAPFQVLRDEFPPGQAALISVRTGAYVQDDIRIAPRLTMNLGLRYDVFPYAFEKYDRLSNFDPATRTMLLAGKDTSRRLRDTDYRNFAPRIGLAYSPGGKTTFRAGYGIGFIDPVGAASALNSPQFNIPFYFRDNITQFPFTAPTYRLSDRLPALTVPSALAPSGDQRYLTPGDRNQYSQTWSLSVQRAITPSLIAEAAYVGTSGSRLLITANINAAPPGSTGSTARRPYGPALGEVRAFTNSGHSTYHGLQTRLEQRFSRGLYFLASYTWSKSIDNQSTGTDDSSAGGQSPQNPLQPWLDRGPSNFDRAHRLATSAVWNLPFWRRSRIAGGWQLSGVLETQTGAPFSVLMPCASVNAEGNNCRPNLIGAAELPEDQRSIQRWFDKTGFAIPAPQAYGNAGRNILRGPGSANLDIAAAKSFAWGGSERRQVRIRGEFFNALNHTNLGLPVHSIDSPANGTITSAMPARVIQLSARVEF